MKLERQVCSLILSKKLKSLGVKQDGYFVWARHKRGLQVCAEYNVIHSEKAAYAFTVAELGDILPAVIEINEDVSAWFASDKSEDGTWLANYGDNGMISLDEVAETEADARALMLIHLIEEGLLKLLKN